MGRPRGGGSTGSYGLRRRSGVNPMLYNTGQELMMECVEEALSPSQLEANRKAKEEHQKAQKMIDDARAELAKAAAAAKAEAERVAADAAAAAAAAAAAVSIPAKGNGSSSPDIMIVGETPPRPGQKQSPFGNTSPGVPRPVSSPIMANSVPGGMAGGPPGAAGGSGAVPHQVYRFVNHGQNNTPGNAQQNQWFLRPIMPVMPQQQAQARGPTPASVPPAGAYGIPAAATIVSGTSGLGIKRPMNAADDFSPSPVNKRPRGRAPSDGNGGGGGNWVPLDEYYYGKMEGDPTYSEEKAEFRFKCWMCNKMLYNNIKAMMHLQGHIDSEKQQNLDLSDLTQCKHCYKQFDTPFEMQTHIEKVHISNMNVLMCRICEKDHESRSALTAHMRQNHCACEMPYACQLCHFRSSMYSDVVDHFKKKHDSSCSLMCLYCLRVFQVKFVAQGWGQTQTYYHHLLRHQSKTTNRKCTFCKLSFFNSQDMKQHRKTQHQPNQKGVIGANAKHGTPDQVMIKVPEAGLLPKKSSGPKSLNAPTISKVTEHRGLRLPREAAFAYCFECKMLMNTGDHYKKYVQCSMCRFATSCSFSYASHMMGFHSGQTSALSYSVPRERPMAAPLYCLCGFVSTLGNRIANHLVSCSKRTASLNKPDIPLADKLGQDQKDPRRKPGASILDVLGLVKKQSVVNTDTEAEQSARDVSDQYADITAFHDVQESHRIATAAAADNSSTSRPATDDNSTVLADIAITHTTAAEGAATERHDAHSAITDTAASEDAATERGNPEDSHSQDTSMEGSQDISERKTAGQGDLTTDMLEEGLMDDFSNNQETVQKLNQGDGERGEDGRMEDESQPSSQASYDGERLVSGEVVSSGAETSGDMAGEVSEERGQDLEQESSQGREEQESSQGREQGSIQGREEQESIQGREEQESIQGREEQESIQGREEQESSQGREEQESIQGREELQQDSEHVQKDSEDSVLPEVSQNAEENVHSGVEGVQPDVSESVEDFEESVHNDVDNIQQDVPQDLQDVEENVQKGEEESQEEISETVQESVADGSTESVQESVAEGSTESVQEGVAEGSTESVQESVAEGSTESVQEGSEDIHAEFQGNVAENTEEDMSDNIQRDEDIQNDQDTQGNVSEEFQRDLQEVTEESISEDDQKELQNVQEGSQESSQEEMEGGQRYPDDSEDPCKDNVVSEEERPLRDSDRPAPGISTVPEEVGTIPEEISSVPEEIGSVPEETGSVPEETCSVPEETGSVSEESRPAPEEDTTVSDKDIAEVSTGQESQSGQEGDRDPGPDRTSPQPDQEPAAEEEELADSSKTEESVDNTPAVPESATDDQKDAAVEEDMEASADRDVVLESDKIDSGDVDVPPQDTRDSGDQDEGVGSSTTAAEEEEGVEGDVGEQKQEQPISREKTDQSEEGSNPSHPLSAPEDSQDPGQTPAPDSQVAPEEGSEKPSHDAPGGGSVEGEPGSVPTEERGGTVEVQPPLPPPVKSQQPPVKGEPSRPGDLLSKEKVGERGTPGMQAAHKAAPGGAGNNQQQSQAPHHSSSRDKYHGRDYDHRDRSYDRSRDYSGSYSDQRDRERDYRRDRDHYYDRHHHHDRHRDQRYDSHHHGQGRYQQGGAYGSRDRDRYYDQNRHGNRGGQNRHGYQDRNYYRGYY